jgi:hypothetical protein
VYRVSSDFGKPNQLVLRLLGGVCSPRQLDQLDQLDRPVGRGRLRRGGSGSVKVGSRGRQGFVKAGFVKEGSRGHMGGVKGSTGRAVLRGYHD